MSRRIVVGSMLFGLVLAGLTFSAQARAPRDNLSARQHGMYFAGLRAKDGGRCAGLYRIEASDGPVGCSHGPDRGPAGIDVTRPRSIADLASAGGGTSTSGAVQCIGDGTSGPRVQAVYAVAADQADRSASVVPLIAGWAGQMDGAVNQSAAETGGERHIRFVTSPDCTLNVAVVTLSATGDDSFANTIDELRAQGVTSSDRKYLIWADASVYCGIAQVAGGDSAAATNPANSGPTFARVDTGCWGRSDHLSELHELMHTLGAVQLSAPHSSGGYHCTDESDAMCYPDGTGATMTYPCPSSHEWLLDCNHDDYFSTSPATGSYLDTHWNVATSVFLAGGSSGAVTPPSPTPSTTTVTTTFSGSISKKRPVGRYPLTVGTGDASSVLTFSASGGGRGKGGGGTTTLELRVLAADGTVLAQGSGPSVLKVVTTLQAGTYTWEVSGTSSISFSLSVTHAS